MLEAHDWTMHRANVLHLWWACRFTAFHRWPFTDFIAIHPLYGRSSILWPFTDFMAIHPFYGRSPTLPSRLNNALGAMWKVALNLTRKLRLNFQVNLSNSTLGFTANSFNNNNEMLDCRLFRVGSKEIAAPASGWKLDACIYTLHHIK